MSSYLYGSYINEFGNNNHENTDILLEYSVYDENKLYIAITPTLYNGFENEPYFKVSWEPINRKNNKVARISMKDGDYIIHNNASVELPSKIVDKINEILKKKPTAREYQNFNTVWDALLDITAKACNVDFKQLKSKFSKKDINPTKEKLKNCKILPWGK